MVQEVQYEELQKHNTAKDCWMAIHGKVRCLQLPSERRGRAAYCSWQVCDETLILRLAGVRRDQFPGAASRRYGGHDGGSRSDASAAHLRAHTLAL